LTGLPAGSSVQRFAPVSPPAATESCPIVFTETREGRRFVGEVPPGLPLVASLLGIIANYRIACGWLDGSGYLRNASLRRVLSDGAFSEPETATGTWLIANLHATVSERNGSSELRIHVHLIDENGSVLAGLLEEGESASVELLVHTFDDITLRRFDDPRAGFGRWLDVAVNMVSSDPESVRSGRLQMEAMPSRLLEPVEMPQLKVGDALEHPRLGFCVITQLQDTDRVSIQMETGKIAQLHLGLLSLVRSASRNGRNVYAVHLRKRNT